MALASCAPAPVVDRPAPPLGDDALDRFLAGEVDPAGEGSGASQAWAVGLARFENEPAARRALETIRAVPGLAGAYVQRRQGKYEVLLGRYEGPADPALRRDVARVREVEIDGVPAFARALPSPPDDAGAGGGAHNLAGVRAPRENTDELLFTLQIAQYGWDDRRTPSPKELAEFRRAAERAVLDLRKAGEEAYYFHGPSGSSVTIGLFTTEQYDPQGARAMDAPEIQDSRARHPNLLSNGKGMRIKVGGQWVLAPSTMVTVP